MARPSKLTPEIQAKIVKAIKAGSYANVAAAHAGVGESTYHEWMGRARQELARRQAADGALERLLMREEPVPSRDEIVAARKARRPKGSETPFVEFLEAVQGAMADSEVHATAQIAVAAKKDWKAAAWLLERRNPDRWRRRTDAVIHHEGPASETGSPVQIVAAVNEPDPSTDTETLGRAAHDFLRAARGRRPGPVDPGDT